MEYVKCGDYLIPNLRLEQINRPIGHWGRLYREYLREHHPVRFTTLVLSGQLWSLLADINDQATARVDSIMDQLKEAEGITEDLKDRDMMAWVQAMNCARSCAEEIVRSELFCSEEDVR